MMVIKARAENSSWIFFDRFMMFFFKPASALPLAVFRIGIAAILLVQAFLMRSTVMSFFASTGLMQKKLTDVLADLSLPSLNSAITIAASFGVSEQKAIMAFGTIYIVFLVTLLLGFFTRTSAFVVWLLHWSFLNTGFSGAYGADMYAHIFLFYLVVIPCGEALSVDKLISKKEVAPSWQARLSLRVMQLHMCISYFASGVEKATGEQWWNGEVIWRALNTPNYSIGNFLWFADVPIVPMALGWGVLAIEIFYSVMVWRKETRMLWVMLTVSLHVGIAILLNLHIFGLLMCVPTIALFAFSSEEHVYVENHAAI